MKTRVFLIVILGWIASVAEAPGASILIHWSNDRTLHQPDVLLPLSAGTAEDGDGTLLEVGYYSLATTATPFAGEWNVLAAGSIGDTGGQRDGFFNITTQLIGGTFIAPPVGTPLAIRLYDASTLADSNLFNAVSNDNGTWNWVEPADDEPELFLLVNKDEAPLWQRGGLGAMRPSIVLPVPEPATALLLVIAGAGACLFRRR